MKNRVLILFTTLAFMSVLFTGCEKRDGEQPYGYAKIYIPQAASPIVNPNNYYAVPSGEGVNTYNFMVEDDNIHIFLGVLRAGKLDSNPSYSVKVTTNTVRADEFVTQNIVTGSEVMPSTLFQLPSTVTIPEGKAGDTFYMTMKLSDITAAANSGKKFMINVVISEPSSFELSDIFTNINVVVFIDSLKAVLEELRMI